MRGIKAYRNPLCRILNIAIIKRSQQPEIAIEIKGNRFLYKMVRNIVETLAHIGLGKQMSGSMKSILKARSREKIGISAPAQGLTLVKINCEAWRPK